MVQKWPNHSVQATSASGPFHVAVFTWHRGFGSVPDASRWAKSKSSFMGLPKAQGSVGLRHAGIAADAGFQVLLLQSRGE